jgi:hypothetical protein
MQLALLPLPLPTWVDYIAIHYLTFQPLSTLLLPRCLFLLIIPEDIIITPPCHSTSSYVVDCLDISHTPSTTPISLDIITRPKLHLHQYLPINASVTRTYTSGCP